MELVDFRISWTRVPQTPHYVLGAFNLRGAVIPLIDLRSKFGLQPKKHTDFIAMKDGNEVAGFVIGRLTEALRIRKSDIGPAPDTLQEDETMIDGVGKQSDRLRNTLRNTILFRIIF
jgi:purine-binding chemotaxis protein CheW